MKLVLVEAAWFQPAHVQSPGLSTLKGTGDSWRELSTARELLLTLHLPSRPQYIPGEDAQLRADFNSVSGALYPAQLGPGQG